MCGVNEVREYSRQKHTRSIDYTCQSGITVPVRNCLKLEEEVFCKTLVPEVSQGVGEAPLLPEDPREAQRMAAGAVAAENTNSVCGYLSGVCTSHLVFLARGLWEGERAFTSSISLRLVKVGSFL